MKRLIRIAMTVLAGTLALASCTGEIEDRLDSVENEVTELKSKVEKINSDLSSVSTIVNKLSQAVTVNSVNKTSNGYTINFSDGTTATISNGAAGSNGKDGSTPVIGTAQENGKYYWTVDNAWLKDAAGNKIPVQGEAGITPQVKIEDGYWFISTDNGSTWTKMGMADSATAVFTAVEETATAVIFTLADGSKITINKTTVFAFDVDKSSLAINMEKGTVTYTFNYTVTGADDQTEVDVICPAGYSATVGEKTITISVAADAVTEAKLFAYASNAATSIIRKIELEGKVMVVSEEKEGKVVKAEGETISLTAITNCDYTVAIPEDCDWIEEVTTRSTVELQKILLKVDENTGSAPRSAVVAIVDESDTLSKVTIAQKCKADYSGTTVVKYLGNKQCFYDDNTWTYTTFGQYAMEFKSGEETIVLVLNNEGSSDHTACFHTGKYTLDEDVEHADNTFSVNTGSEKIYTKIVAGTDTLDVVDGEINVAAENDTYTITGSLTDSKEKAHEVSFTGKVAVVDESAFATLGSGSVTSYGQYYTYFSTKANQWYITVYLSDPANGSMNLVSLTFNLFGQADASVTEIPTGRYTWTEEPENDPDITYAEGKKKAQPGTFSFSASTQEQNYAFADGGVLYIAKNDDGTYHFSIDITGYVMGYTEDWDYIKLSEGKYVNDFDVDLGTISEPEVQPILDEDHVAEYVMNTFLMPYYFGQPFGNDISVVRGGWTNIDGNWTVQFMLGFEGEYVITNTLQGRAKNNYTDTEIPYGTYTFSTTAGNMTILPAKLNGQNQSHITNSYTGTRFYIDGGSINLEKDKVTYALTGTSTSGKTISFTGSNSSKFYYGRNYRTSYESHTTL